MPVSGLSCTAPNGMVAPGKVCPCPPVPIAIFTYFVLSACEWVLEGASNKEWTAAGNAAVSFTKQAKDAADTPPRKSLLDTIVTSKPTVSNIPINVRLGQLHQ